MALRWEWKECIGELETENQEETKIRIYQGNAFAIFLNEWIGKDGQEKWSMHMFFADKRHFDNCKNDKDWNYAEGWKKITLWKVPSDLWPFIKDLYKRGVIIEIKGAEQ